MKFRLLVCLFSKLKFESFAVIMCNKIVIFKLIYAKTVANIVLNRYRFLGRIIHKFIIYGKTLKQSGTKKLQDQTPHTISLKGIAIILITKN